MKAEIYYLDDAHLVNIFLAAPFGMLKRSFRQLDDKRVHLNAIYY